MSQDELNPEDAHQNPQANADQRARQEFFDLVPAYCIDATDEHETQFVAANLAAYPESVELMEDYAGIQRALLHSVDARTPSSALAHRLQQAIRQGDAEAAESQSSSWWNRILDGIVGQGAMRLAFGALLLLLIGLNVITLARLFSLQAQNDELARRLTSHEEALALITNENTESYTLSSAEENVTANAAVRWMPDSNVAILTAEDFPELQPDMAYQLWLIRDGQRTSGGLFTVDSRGSGMLLIIAPEPMDEFDSMGITPEPISGSAGPTAPPVVFGTL